jgi:hypothetical protein
VKLYLDSSNTPSGRDAQLKRRDNFTFYVKCRSAGTITSRLSMMKLSRAISRVKWLSGEKTNVSKTISVLVLRVLVWLWLGKTFLPNLYLTQSVYATGRWAGSIAALLGSVSCLNKNLVPGFQARLSVKPLSQP